ncbi:hypothetical protein Anapl_03562 [Anas platyrhynchos]|uniref:Uncharacterized protein n=1 Tax=Anas platyrhynchos TaxID=8839 RepID=R0K6A5_ANAPL|nr:hypothetical protein Anapl_03562 [Anas platyrhynchos]
MGKTSFARAGLHRTFGLSTLTTVDSLECNIQTIGLPCPLQQPPYVLQAPLPEVSSGMHRGAGVLYGNQALLSRVNPSDAVSSELPNEKPNRQSTLPSRDHLVVSSDVFIRHQVLALNVISISNLLHVTNTASACLRGSKASHASGGSFWLGILTNTCSIKALHPGVVTPGQGEVKSLITVIGKVANTIAAGWCLDLDALRAVNGCQFLAGEAAVCHPGVLHGHQKTAVPMQETMCQLLPKQKSEVEGSKALQQKCTQGSIGSSETQRSK